MRKTVALKAIAAAALAAATVLPTLAQAQGLMIRARALNLQSENKDSTGLNLSVNDKTFPEVDISYFLTPNFAAELILTVPQQHDIRAGGTNIGSLKQLPPTLLAQYHFTGFGAFKPYVGAGVNYTRLSSVSFVPAVVTALNPSLEKDSFGLALQIGADYFLTPNWSINLDIKKVQIGFDVKSSGTKVGEFKVDPLLVGVGVGYRF